jgi:DNA polymerase bacteriophage-type
MSWPNKKTGMLPERTPEVMQRISDYCAKDVEIETRLRHKLGLLSEQSPHERGVWTLDQKINQRGVRIDLDFVRQAQAVVDRATVPLLAEFRDLTGGVNPTQRDKVMAWCAGQGVQLDSLRKEYLTELLGAEEEDTDVTAGYESLSGDDEQDGDGVPKAAGSLPPGLRRVLGIRQMLGSASIKKLARMRACVGPDGRARGLLQYHAAGTGRWGGRLFQPQNFPRGALKCSPDDAVDAIMSGDPEYVEMMLGLPAIEAVSSSLRHALIPDPGKVFCVGDFAGIEMRVVLALAGQHDKCDLLATGKDVYLDMANDIYNRRDLTKADIAERTIGKNTVLGCGFGMGPSKFHDRYCPKQPVEFAEQVVMSYRKQWAPKVPPLWYGLEAAALRGVTLGYGEAYGVAYRKVDGWLVAELPSGWQRIWYPEPRPFHDVAFDKNAWFYSAYKGGKLSHAKAYGGLLTENTVQGLARGLLVASMMRLERNNYPIVLTVHDEAVCEVDEAKADVHEFEQLMAEPTQWAREIGIPIAVEAWQGDRYRK